MISNIRFSSRLSSCFYRKAIIAHQQSGISTLSIKGLRYNNAHYPLNRRQFSTETVTKPLETSNSKKIPLLPSTPEIDNTFFPKFDNFEQFKQWYVSEPLAYRKYSKRWWLSSFWKYLVIYGATGLLAMKINRFFFKNAGYPGVNLINGEPLQRFCYFLCMMPTYALCMMFVGSLLGRPTMAIRTGKNVFLKWGSLGKLFRKKTK